MVLYSAAAAGTSEGSLLTSIADAFAASNVVTDASGIPLEFRLVRVQKVSA